MHLGCNKCTNFSPGAWVKVDKNGLCSFCGSDVILYNKENIMMNLVKLDCVHHKICCTYMSYHKFNLNCSHCFKYEQIIKKETFSNRDIITAIESWITLGEDMGSQGNQQGYFSDVGWAARVLKYHLKELQKGVL